MENLEENNELIAEFMEIDQVDIDTFLEEHQNLKYHTSWNWLMLVVKKCWKIANEQEIDFAAMMSEHRFDYVAYGDIEESFEAIVEFIKHVENLKK